MTELLYHTDAYLQEFDATVTSVLEQERAVVLDRTAFYPGGEGNLVTLVRSPPMALFMLWIK